MGWLSGWDQRVKITISNTNVDANLTHFPVLLTLGASVGTGAANVEFIFDEVGANSKKIAVTTSDGTSEIYVEIEKWDNGNKDAWLWVSKSDFVVSSSAPTILYLYFDVDHADNDAYVADIGSRTEVWDATHKMVQHMVDTTTSTTMDSTSNNNDGTKESANNPLAAAAKINGGQTFSSDYILIPDSVDWDFGTGDFCLEAWIYGDNLEESTEHPNIFVRGDPFNNAGEWAFQIIASTAGAVARKMNFYGDANTINLQANTQLADGVWYYICVMRSGGNFHFYLNGASDSGDSAEACDFDGDEEIALGYRFDVGYGYFNGQMDEVRISSAGRAAAWIKANFYTQTDALLAWSGEGFNAICAVSTISSLTISGGRITPGAVSIQSVASLIALATRQFYGACSIQSISSLIAIGSAIVPAVVAISIVSSLSIDGNVVRSAIAAIESVASLAADPDVIRSGVVSIASIASMTADPLRIQQGIAAIEAVSSLIADGDAIKGAIVAIQSIASLIADGDRIAGAVAAIAVVASLVPDGNVIRSAIAAIESISSLTADGDRIAMGVASIASISSLSALATKVIQGAVVITAVSSAEMIALAYITQSFGYSGTLTAGDELVIDVDAMTVKLNGTNTRALFSGTFPQLYVGTNELRWKDEDASRDLEFETAHKPRYL